MGITFAYELGLKSFYMKNHPLKILKNLKEKKLRAFQDLEGKNSKKIKLTSGAPFARCATSNRKKIGLKKNLDFFSKYDT